MPKAKSEFELISSLFAPLAEGVEGAFGLRDDAAQIAPRRGWSFVVSVDGFVSGVHFRADDPPEAVGEKIVRASLSDLAAMGAHPLYWFLTAAFSKDMRFADVKKFAQGCARAQRRYGVKLIGGDTTTTKIASKKAATFSAMVVGEVKKPVRRNGARPGDQLYVTGHLGDAALGLQYPQNKFLARRYLYPEPRLDLGRRLSGLAHAAIDLSDGLMADCAHLCRESQTGAVIRTHLLPLSRAARLVKSDLALRRLALNAGDDYELLIAVPTRRAAKLCAAARSSGTKITLIGEVVEQASGVVALNKDGRAVRPLREGFRHFIGA